MKLALHRSITFWSGLLVMAFVCWAWHSSYFLTLYANHRGYGVSHTNGGILLVKSNDMVTRHGTHGKGLYIRSETFPPPLYIRSADTPPSAVPPDQRSSYTIKENWEDVAKRQAGITFIFSPHWIILPAVALLWLALLFWRTKRRTAAMAA